MNIPTVLFGLQQTYYLQGTPETCADPKCGRSIGYGSLIYRDITDNNLYCESCGKCLRYKRKKQAERSPERELEIRKAGLGD